MRCLIVAGGTRGACPRAASVPRRSEYGNTWRYENGSASTSASVAAKSASVSPGKPTMTSAPRPRPGIAAARRSTSARYIATLYGRRIGRSTRSLPLWSGTWRWRQTRRSPTISSSSSSVK